MALFAWSCFILFKPLINKWLERIQFWITFVIRWHRIRIIEVCHVNVFGDSLPIESGNPGDFRYVG